MTKQLANSAHALKLERFICFVPSPLESTEAVGGAPSGGTGVRVVPFGSGSAKIASATISVGTLANGVQILLPLPLRQRPISLPACCELALPARPRRLRSAVWRLVPTPFSGKNCESYSATP